jgi:exonuclease VII small subunit
LQLAEWLSSESITNLEQPKSGEIDHSFAKRVADEIVRMQTNLSRMDESIKGFKQLNSSVRKLEQSLNSNQYELEDLLNRPYDNGMNLQATFIEDENLKEGESIITRIIKPQINYKGKLIQAAQIEVSQGL